MSPLHEILFVHRLQPQKHATIYRFTNLQLDGQKEIRFLDLNYIEINQSKTNKDFHAT